MVPPLVPRQFQRYEDEESVMSERVPPVQMFWVVEQRPSTGANTNDAVMPVLAEIVVVHVPVPEQVPPDQPMNIEPVDGVAVNVTDVPDEITAEQVEPQLIPEPVTVPEPEPDFVVVNVYVTTGTDAVVTEMLPD